MENAPKPDFGSGGPAGSVADGGRLSGRVGAEDALLIRRGDAFYAVGAYCSHYHGSLADGLIVGDTVRCPLHHACFDLHSGKALRAPALDPLACWRVERRGYTVFVHEKLSNPSSVVIVGGGAAGLSAAHTLRQEGYQ